MRLPGFDMIFGLAAPAIDILVERARVALVQIGDDEARVRPFRADFDAGDDPLDAAPALGAVIKLLEAAELAVSRRGLEARLRAGLEAFDMASQGAGRRDAEDIVEAVAPTPGDDLGAAIGAVCAQQALCVRPVCAGGPQQATHASVYLPAPRPLCRAEHGGG